VREFADAKTARSSEGNETLRESARTIVVGPSIAASVGAVTRAINHRRVARLRERERERKAGDAEEINGIDVVPLIPVQRAV